MSPQIKSLLRRSASKPRADQYLTEEQAAERFPTDIYLAKFTPMRHTLTGRHARTVMKLVVEEWVMMRTRTRVAGVEAKAAE